MSSARFSARSPWRNGREPASSRPPRRAEGRIVAEVGEPQVDRQHLDRLEHLARSVARRPAAASRSACRSPPPGRNRRGRPASRASARRAPPPASARRRGRRRCRRSRMSPCGARGDRRHDIRRARAAADDDRPPLGQPEVERDAGQRRAERPRRQDEGRNRQQALRTGASASASAAPSPSRAPPRPRSAAAPQPVGARRRERRRRRDRARRREVREMGREPEAQPQSRRVEPGRHHGHGARRERGSAQPLRHRLRILGQPAFVGDGARVEHL